MPTRWSDDPREDFDRCPDHFKDAVAQVMDGRFDQYHMTSASEP